jgi:hypothetical protein
MKQTGNPEDRPESGSAHGANGETESARAVDPKRSKQGVDPEIARQIDENLKRLYQQQVELELPPELQALVDRLRSSGEPDSGGKGPQ